MKSNRKAKQNEVKQLKVEKLRTKVQAYVQKHGLHKGSK